MSDTGGMSTVKQHRNTPSRDADTQLGTRAHMLMWKEGLKQGEVATAIGMSSGSLGLKLKGQRGWALAEIIALAETLNSSVAYLVGETENPHQSPDGGNVGPAGIEPTTYGVEYREFAPVISLADFANQRIAVNA